MSSDRERDRATAVETSLPLARSRFIALDLGANTELIGASVQHEVLYFQIGDALWHFRLPDKQTAMGHRSLHYDPRFLVVDSFTALLWGRHTDGDYSVPSPNYSKRRVAAECLFAVNSCDTLATTESFTSPRDYNACAGSLRFAALTHAKGELTVWNGKVGENNTITFQIAYSMWSETQSPAVLAGNAFIVDMYNNVWSMLPLMTERALRVRLYRPLRKTRDVTLGGMWASPNATTVASTRVATWRQCLVVWGRAAPAASWQVAMVVPGEEPKAKQLRVHYFSLPPALSATLDNDRGCMCFYPTRVDDKIGVSVFQLPAL